MLAVIDTSVFIAGLISKTGSPRSIIQAINTGLFVPVVSKTLLEELNNVVTRPKFHAIIHATEAKRLIEHLYRDSLIVEPSVILKRLTADFKDDPFIEAAVAARAKYVVSLDRHLLDLKSFQGISIIRPKEFLENI